MVRIHRITTGSALVVAASLVVLFAIHPRAALAGQDAKPEQRTRNVAIVVFPGVELLDFAGPGEVFSVAHGKDGQAFKVFTVAESKEPLSSMDFVTITPQFTLQDCPKTDIVVIPGGEVPSNSAKLLDWVRTRSKDAELMMSVCNGALVYAKAGLLKGQEVTTHHSALKALALFEPDARVFTNRRFVDNGHVLTSAGIAAGIDGALHVVERFCGQDVAWKAARSMEYDWRPDEIAKLHAQPGIPVEGAEGLHWVGSIRRLGVPAALAEYRQLEKPPTEAQLNTWGYWLLREPEVDAAIDLFRLVSTLFPNSSNAMDSLSEALEAKSDIEGSKQAARDCLARLEKEVGRSEADRTLVRNAASSRLARLAGTPASQMRFVCPPCGRECDTLGFLEGGACPNCRMELVERAH